nr:hypothetical protein [Tanacetum cinerariifolium]
MNHATEAGYWKATGKDREVKYKDKIVATIKTTSMCCANCLRKVAWAQKTVFEEEEWDNMDDNEVISFESSAMITKDTFNSNAAVTNITLTELASSTLTSSDNERFVVHEGANKTQYSNARQFSCDEHDDN